MKRSGFTMIELIFVIVILGILAAVALPRLVGVQEEARIAKAGELVSNLNSVVGPNMYGKSIIDGNASIWDMNISTYTEIPTNFDANGTTGFTRDTNNCVKSFALTNNPVMHPIYVDSTNNIRIFCMDGNATTMPRFWYSQKPAAAANTVSISEASF